MLTKFGTQGTVGGEIIFFMLNAKFNFLKKTHKYTKFTYKNDAFTKTFQISLQ